jgi:hypothetical protein
MKEGLKDAYFQLPGSIPHWDGGFFWAPPYANAAGDLIDQRCCLKVCADTKSSSNFVQRLNYQELQMKSFGGVGDEGR